MNVHIITIGDEILIGQIVDTNSAWMGTELNLRGFNISQIKTISDGYEDITSALDAAFHSDADIILTTGGLGPTKDDITKKCIADYFGVDTYFDEELYERICSFFERLGRDTTELHRLQCYMPKGVQLLKNKMGTAPGMLMEKNGKILISMPGVPYEMKHIMEARVLPLLVEKYNPAPILHKTLLTAGYGETTLADEIEDIESSLPEELKIAYLPNLGQVRLRLSFYGKKGDSLESMQELIDKYAHKIQERLGNKIFGTGTQSLEEVLGKRLLEKKMTLATAESCTGGNIAARIVQIPGSSRYFQGGVIAYSNEIKMKQLNVKPDTLKNHGAVSEETVREMVQGTIDLLNVDVAVSVSGIAGPDGGTEEKPVGTIWLAVGNKDEIITEKLSLGKYRLKNIEYTTKKALNMVRLFLLEN